MGKIAFPARLRGGPQRGARARVRGPVARARSASRAVAVPAGVSSYWRSGQSLPGASSPSARQGVPVREMARPTSCSPGGSRCGCPGTLPRRRAATATGQRVGCRLRRELCRLQQPVGHRADDLPPGRAAPPVDPGFGALGQDHRRHGLAQQLLPGLVQVGAHQFLLAGFPAPRPGYQVAAGDGQFQDLGGRGPCQGFLGAHHRAPRELRQARRGDAGRGDRTAEGGLPLLGAGRVGGQDLACRRRPADGGVARHLQQVERAGQRGGDPRMIVLSTARTGPALRRRRSWPPGTGAFQLS